MSGKCPFDPEVIRFERETIPVIAGSSYPNLVSDDALVERLNTIREKYPFVIFEGNPAIHFLGWNEVGEVYRNWPLFSSTQNHAGLENFKPSGEVPMIPAGYDPPQAHIYKTFLQQKYREADALAFEPVARGRAVELIDSFIAKGECEYMEDFAAHFFGPILLGYVGIPAEDIDLVQRLEQETFFVPERDPGGKIQANAAHSLATYLVDLVRKARAALPPEGKRDDDLLTYMLTQPMTDGKLMSDEEVKAALHIMCLGGAHSVKAAIGYAMKLLADRPDLRAGLLDADGFATPEKIEELLRWNGVGGGMSYRRVTKQAELAGCPLEPDDIVCTVMTAANHDPRASEDANEARFDRERVKSFTFAFGTHRCLGIHFAKLGTKVAIEEWHRRIPNYRVKENVEVVEQVWAGVGYLELPLVWSRPERAA